MTEAIQSVDAERAFLGAVLSGYPDLDDLASVVEPSDFWQPFHEAVWDACLRVHHTGNAVDAVSVRLAMSGQKHDPMKLVDLAQAAPVVAQAPYYAEQVAQASGLRRIQAAGAAIQQLGASEDLADAREQARARIDEATRGREASRARTLATIMPAVLEHAEHGEQHVLGTGWADLDRLIGGLAPGRVVIVGARPGIGKSVMGTNLVLHFAHKHKHAVLMASLEMTELEVGQRLLAAHASVNLTGLQMGTSDEAAWSRIARKTQELNDLPLTVDDSPTQGVTAIRKAARDVQRQRDDLALIVVDYLQLVQPRDSRANRTEQVAEISRGLKLLARETGACVVAMAQTNREAIKHSDGKPKMSDLRESGAIEADADVVILMHQPDPETTELELIVDKNRHGPKGVCRLQLQGHYARLVSVEWHPTKGLTA
jgi:replicative DNA helicase